ncbi:hypothetical protein PCL_09700 [Purpureocillium lilacinum]|uniref:Uncharacterized protein n=1 Tax=Purpureocillium lilacinum TaxID=33203 RepID=A0A2U3EDU2_PURLI|nr:hypothetical protein PCL_09700 [Purpureocillium lilacinum]
MSDGQEIRYVLSFRVTHRHGASARREAVVGALHLLPSVVARDRQGPVAALHPSDLDNTAEGADSLAKCSVAVGRGRYCMRLVDELAPGPGPRARTRRQRSGPVAYEHELGELYCQGTSRCMKRYTSQGTLCFLSMPSDAIGNKETREEETLRAERRRRARAQQHASFGPQ